MVRWRLPGPLLRRAHHVSSFPALAAPLLAAFAFACGADQRDALPASPDAGGAAPVVVSPSASGSSPDDACSKMDILLCR